VDKGTPIYRLGKMVGHAAAYRMGYRKLAKKAQIAAKAAKLRLKRYRAPFRY